MVLLEDSAALVGIVIAAAATAAAAVLAQPVWDGVGSILIGVLLAITSIGLARESKSLLIGEPAHSDLSRSILDIARHSPGVLRVNGLLTVQLSPAEVVAALSVEFADDKRADDIEQCVIVIETDIRRQHPSVAALFIKPQTNARFHAVRARRGVREAETASPPARNQVRSVVLVGRRGRHLRAMGVIRHGAYRRDDPLHRSLYELLPDVPLHGDEPLPRDGRRACRTQALSPDDGLRRNVPDFSAFHADQHTPSQTHLR
ncbi:hypothetical protein ABID62_008530 [Bradyrhizobium sp. S3.9.1]